MEPVCGLNARLSSLAAGLAIISDVYLGFKVILRCSSCLGGM